jgi:hypothetical protein
VSSTLGELRRRLRDGLAGNVLEDLADAVVEGKPDSLAFARVLLSLVARDLASTWEGPVSSVQANALTTRFGPLFTDMLLALESGDEPAVRLAADSLAIAYMGWLAQT